MALKCVGTIEDFKKMFKEYSAKNELVTEAMKEGIHYAMTRQEVLGIPLFKQDLAYRLIKLNQIDRTMWGTDFIKNVYKMVEDLDEFEASNQAKIWDTAGQLIRLQTNKSGVKKPIHHLTPFKVWF